MFGIVSKLFRCTNGELRNRSNNALRCYFGVVMVRLLIRLGCIAIRLVDLSSHQLSYHAAGNKRQASNRNDYHVLVGHCCI